MFDAVHARYLEPHRSYHAPSHIDFCLRHFDAAETFMDEPDAVEMTLWFHDGVYDVPAVDNELRSADLFAKEAGGRGREAFLYKVYRLILITRHPQTPRTVDEAFVVDIDLAGFGQPWEAFTEDTRRVRDEQACFDGEEFSSDQLNFAQLLLSGRSVFHSRFFRERYEAAAQRNLRRHIAELQAGRWLS